jgi:glucuronate isomerase
MSYPRHEYFRRVLCNLIGRDVENGQIPDDDSLLGPMIRNICHENARNYLALPEIEKTRPKTAQPAGKPAPLRAK